MATIIGTAGDDLLDGLPEGDSISGLAGNDLIIGREGDDTLDGGDGDDQIRGGAGNDLILGGPGSDSFEFGEAGDDTIIGGDGDDHLRGGSGLDVFDGAAGLDRVSFFHLDAIHGAHADIASQTIFDDGYGNAETMSSIEGLGAGTIFADVFTGDGGPNLIWVGKGDKGYAYGGDDSFFIDEGPALADGGAGIDTILGFSGIRLIDPDGDGVAEGDNATHGVVVDLGVKKILDDGWGGTGRVRNIENVGGSGFADTLIGDNDDNALAGHDGDDVLKGDKGADTRGGEAGADTLAGGLQADRFVFGEAAGQDRITDFQDGLDQVELHAIAGVASFAALTIVAAGGGSLVSWGGAGDSVLLDGVAPASLTAADFLFT